MPKIQNEFLREKKDMFDDLSNIGFRGKKALQIVKFIELVHKEAEVIEKVRTELIKKYGSEQEEGLIGINPDTNLEAYKQFIDEYGEVAKEYTEVECGFTLSEDEVESMNLTVDQIKLCVLAGIVELSEEEPDEDN